MRVLHLGAGNLFGGVETYLITLAKLRHLCSSMEPHFGVCFPGRLRDELTATGVPVHDMGAVRVSRPWTVLRARWRLKQLLRQTKFDAVVAHSSWPHAIFAPVVRKFGVRLIHALHGETDPKNLLNRWATRTPPDVVIANSRFIAEQTKELFPGVPRSTVYLPVEPPSVDRVRARQTVRGELETPPEIVVILIVSRIEDLKGHTVLINALGRLRAVSGWCCWVVGSAQRPHEVALLANLREQVNQSGIANHVQFVGARSDVNRVMAAADIYCQPNTRPEGFGLTFIEAMYAGLPVVTSNFGGALEIVTPQCGVLCPPNDATTVAAALRDLIEDPTRRQTLGSAGPPRAMQLCRPSQQLNTLGQLVGVHEL